MSRNARQRLRVGEYAEAYAFDSRLIDQHMSASARSPAIRVFSRDNAGAKTVTVLPLAAEL